MGIVKFLRRDKKVLTSPLFRFIMWLYHKKKGDKTMIDLSMFHAYLDKNPATYYVIFSRLPSRINGTRAYAICKDTMKNLPDVAPELFTGSTDGVPRIKLLMYNKTERAINMAGGWIVRKDFPISYTDVEKGINGTRSSALEKMSMELFADMPGVKRVTHIGNLKGSETGAIADVRIEWINGLVEYVETKSRCGRFNVVNGKDGFTKGGHDYNFRVTYENGFKDIIMLEDARIFKEMLQELGYDSTIINLETGLTVD